MRADREELMSEEYVVLIREYNRSRLHDGYFVHTLPEIEESGLYVRDNPANWGSDLVVLRRTRDAVGYFRYWERVTNE